MAWALVADALPLYPLYALLFVDHGLTEAEISALFALWSAVGIVAEVPSGAVADRWSRRGCLVAGGVLHAAAFAVWMLAPTFGGFAAGFAVWSIGGALVSGAQEALLYDSLAAIGEQERYVHVQGRVTAAGLVAQLPAAGAATLLFTAGGFALVGWVSVGMCLVAALLAARLPEPARRRAAEPTALRGHDVVAPPDPTALRGRGGVDDPEPAGIDDAEEPGYLATLRAGVGEAVRSPAVRTVLVAAAVLGGLDAVEEYFPLITADAGAPVDLVPLAVVPIVLAGTAGAALGGRAGRLRGGALAAITAVALVLLGAGVHLGGAGGIAAVTVFYGLYRAVLVVVDARLQERIDGPARATVTSVAGLAVEIAGLGVFAAWAAGGGLAVAASWLVAALFLPWLLRARPSRPSTS